MTQSSKIILAICAAALVAGVYWAYPVILQKLAIGQRAAIARGQVLYGENCAVCHGVNLEGQPDWQTPDEDGIFPPPPHNEDGHTWHHDDTLLFAYTKFGGASAMETLGLNDFKSGMPGFGPILTDAEIEDIWVYIKSTWTDQMREVQDEFNRNYEELERLSNE